jgi:raffinose/stachyose/melibiose transport system substrate-binding protein
LFGGPANVNKNVKSASTDPLDLAWGKIFGQFHDVFVNGDQAFPLDVTTEYFRVVNEAASDYLDPKAAASELQKFIASRK